MEIKLKRLDEWYQFVLDNPKFWANGFTLNRLIKIKQKVLCDRALINDLMFRHSGNEYNPSDLRDQFPDVFNHAIANFIGGIHFILNRQNNPSIMNPLTYSEAIDKIAMSGPMRHEIDPAEFIAGYLFY